MTKETKDQKEECQVHLRGVECPCHSCEEFTDMLDVHLEFDWEPDQE